MNNLLGPFIAVFMLGYTLGSGFTKKPAIDLLDRHIAEYTKYCTKKEHYGLKYHNGISYCSGLASLTIFKQEYVELVVKDNKLYNKSGYKSE